MTDTTPLLSAINELRATGWDAHPPAGALALDPRLTAVAMARAGAMAQVHTFSHWDAAGNDGPARVSMGGYAWSVAGENIARGQPDADSVLVSWRDSPGHLDVMMNPAYVHVGLGVVVCPPNEGGDPAWFPTYWVAVFAAPP